jgi:very-short-patch-repair endonuclease
MNYEFGYYQSVPEPDFINKIRTIFSIETFESQKRVLNYYIDLYMPRYNLAIEFDESHHRWEQDQDRIREERIAEQLGCAFIRVKETDDICIAASRIFAPRLMLHVAKKAK